MEGQVEQAFGSVEYWIMVMMIGEMKGMDGKSLRKVCNYTPPLAPKYFVLTPFFVSDSVQVSIPIQFASKSQDTHHLHLKLPLGL